jgi:D-lactate dehydrogenase (cytochrome)
MTPLPQTVVDSLKELLGERFSESGIVRAEHAKDVSHHAPRSPQAVVFPESNEEVSKIVRICAGANLPIIPFGTGTAVEGGVVAIQGGLCVDLRRMNKIKRVSVADCDATVEAGVTRQQLNRFLEEQKSGVYFPIDPGADASLGGMAATCASGSAAVKYGTMRTSVLALTVVLANGEIIHIGTRARKSSAGYDLTRLFVGSEGTLGIITEVTLKLAPLPEAVTAAVCPFPDVDSAVQCVIRAMSLGLPLARIELLDEVQMAAVNRYSKLDYEVTPTLFLEFQGSPQGVVEQTERMETLVREFQGGPFRWASDPLARQKLWQARHDCYYASLALREGGKGFVTDVCVPISRLAECINWAKDELKSIDVPGPLFGHVGDGNFHVVFVIEPGNERELAAVKDFSRRLSKKSLELGGTVTGEHGIGLGKLDDLESEQGPAIEVMRAIKRALDPQNLMNPGKVLRLP